MTTITATGRVDECAPETRITRSLLGYGILAGPCYVIASVVEGLTRPGFDFSRHDWSLLALGDRGWVHILVLVLTGLMVVAAAVGIARTERAAGRRAVAARLLAGYGIGLVGAGVFPADPAAGFPPGTPDTTTVTVSGHGMLHLLCGGLGFLCFVACCLVLARRFLREPARRWALFSALTGLVFLAAFGGVASSGGGSASVLTFTAAVVLAWSWLCAVSLRAYRATAHSTEAGR